MKKLVFGCLLAVGCAFMPTATAQDYGCGQYCAPPCGWNDCCNGFDGFYVGGNLGVLSHVAHRNDLDGFFTDNSGWSTIKTDFTAGVQLGWDWQCCSTVLGIVADWNWVNVRQRLREEGDNLLRSDFNWFSTIRGRVGVPVCDALIYLTAGGAVSRHKVRWEDPPLSFKQNHNRWGWVGGVGLEFKVWCNFSLGAELLYLHFGNRDRRFTSGVTEFRFGQSDHAYVGRILLNYRFGDLCSCF